MRRTDCAVSRQLPQGLLRSQAQRLDRAWERESGRFQHDYNDRLLAGLVGLSLLDILVFRFLARVALLETLGWLAFAFLQVSGCRATLTSGHAWPLSAW